MDYLVQNKKKASSQNSNDKNAKQMSTFNVICEYAFEKLNPDELVEISNKYLTSSILTVMKDTDLIECINAFFNNNLNISETSRNAFLHRNTLLYRIEKIYAKTGLNIRNFDDAITFKILLFIYKKMNYITKDNNE